jgi:hypothetical protein
VITDTTDSTGNPPYSICAYSAGPVDGRRQRRRRANVAKLILMARRAEGLHLGSSSPYRHTYVTVTKSIRARRLRESLNFDRTGNSLYASSRVLLTGSD